MKKNSGYLWGIYYFTVSKWLPLDVLKTNPNTITEKTKYIKQIKLFKKTLKMPFRKIKSSVTFKGGGNFKMVKVTIVNYIFNRIYAFIYVCMHAYTTNIRRIVKTQTFTSRKVFLSLSKIKQEVRTKAK